MFLRVKNKNQSAVKQTRQEFIIKKQHQNFYQPCITAVNQLYFHLI
jgi:hypothetical protein